MLLLLLLLLLKVLVLLMLSHLLLFLVMLKVFLLLLLLLLFLMVLMLLLLLRERISLKNDEKIFHRLGRNIKRGIRCRLQKNERLLFWWAVELDRIWSRARRLGP